MSSPAAVNIVAKADAFFGVRCSPMKSLEFDHVGIETVVYKGVSRGLTIAVRTWRSEGPSLLALSMYYPLGAMLGQFLHSLWTAWFWFAIWVASYMDPLGGNYPDEIYSEKYALRLTAYCRGSRRSKERVCKSRRETKRTWSAEGSKGRQEQREEESGAVGLDLFVVDICTANPEPTLLPSPQR